MAQVTTYGVVSQRTAAWAATEMLKHAEPILVLNRFGQSKPLPRNKADTMKFRRIVPFDALSTPLQEGITPTAQQMQYEDVTVQMKQWGKPIIITDVVNDMAEDPVLKDASQQAGEQAARTIEQVTYGVVRAGSNVFRANGAARSDINTPLTKSKQAAVTRFLKAQKAMKMTSVLASSPNFATRAVEAAYIAVAHTDLEWDIRALPGFIPVASYGSRQAICAEEIGSVDDVRYVLSPDLAPFEDAGGAYNGSGTNMVSTTGVSADVYPILIFGKDAYGTVPLKGAGAITPKVLNPDTPDKSDPLGQRGYVSWKAYFNAVILNDSWMCRLEVAATAL